MRIDFLDYPCQRTKANCQIPDIICKRTVKDKKFGLCDDTPPPALPAYIDTQNPGKWIAIVQNNQAINISFKAIDNCVIIKKGNSKNKESTCDGVLTYTNNIIFVELKTIRTGGWIKDGVEQLKHTIYLFFDNYNPSVYRTKRAFLANKKFPSFKYTHKDNMRQFRNETGVRLIIHNEIKI